MEGEGVEGGCGGEGVDENDMDGWEDMEGRVWMVGVMVKV